MKWPLDRSDVRIWKEGAEGVRQEQRLSVGVAGGSDNCLTSCVAPALVLNGAGVLSDRSQKHASGEEW